MNIVELNKGELIYFMRQSLGLPQGESGVDEILIAASIRRIAGFQCPCSATSIVAKVLESFFHLIEDEVEFKFKVENVLDRLLVGGDLLELSDIETNDLRVRSTWIFAGHPAFLARPKDTFFIFGVVPDEISPVPTLSNRIKYQGCKRVLESTENEDLPSMLRDFGLFEISESTWLKLPKHVEPGKMLSLMNERLGKGSVLASTEDLMILNPKTNPTYYKSRWTTSGSFTGRFVAKRPYSFGMNIWCYVELKDGNLERFIDLPSTFNGIIQRGCDTAWYLQMAIDFLNGTPQLFFQRPVQGGKIFDFYSPIPRWAERRLIAIGIPADAVKCLFSYFIQDLDIVSEEQFLRERLWLSQKI